MVGTLGIVLFHRIIDNVFTFELKNNILQKIALFIKEMLVITVSAQIIIIPIMALNFNKISIMFWLSNILASPIIAICIIGGFIIIFISFIQLQIAQIVAIPIECFLNLLLLISEKIANIPFANITIATPKLAWIFIYYILLTILLYNKRQNKKQYKIEKKIIINLKKHAKQILIIASIICIISYGIKFIEPKIYIHFIDVGQGDSTLIITKTGKKILVDGGGTNTTYDVGKNVLLPYLLDRGITKIDYAIISHFDSDHCLRCANNYGRDESR